MVLNMCVAKGTFLGAPSHPERKPTFVILTEEYIFAGPSMAECRRMLQEKQDKTAIHFAGEAPPVLVENIGDYFERRGLGFVFR